MQPDQRPTRRRRRVPAMAPEARRAAIVEAAVPLLREHGPGVSTKRIAEAAGVAEGTVFSAFGDKQSLIHAAILSAVDPQPVERRLAELSPHLDLRARLLMITRILTRQFIETTSLFMTMRRAAVEQRRTWRPAEPGSDAPGPDAPAPPPKHFMAEMIKLHERMLAAVTAAVEPHRDELRHPPPLVARMLLALTTMHSHPGGFVDEVAPSTIVSVLLDGALTPDRKPTADPTPATEDSTSC